tara:strand:- start:3007 stop:4059 length:1053 start_codon:yes stop_codon:yes gene_type:complete
MMEGMAMGDQLTEETTPEEMQKIVDDIAAERTGEPEGKSDAQITSEHSNNEHKETPAEEKPGSEAAEVDTGDGDDTATVDDQGDDSGDQSWIDDDLKAEVAVYGIEESELADFASREELELALRFLDKRAQAAGREALAETDGEGEAKGATRNEKGQFTKGEDKQDPPKADPPSEARDGQYEVKLDKDVYDEDVVEEFTRMRDHYESRLSALESRIADSQAYYEDAAASVAEQRFDSAVDALKMPKLFGTTGKESPQELERRQDLLVQAKAQQLGLKKVTGRDVDIESLVARVAPMVFSEDFDKQKLKSRTRKISKQSNGRQGGGATRPQDPREDPRDEADRLYKELEGK